MDLPVIGGDVSTSGPKGKKRHRDQQARGRSGLCESDNASNGSRVYESNGNSDRAVADLVIQKETPQVDLSEAQGFSLATNAGLLSYLSIVQ